MSALIKEKKLLPYFDMAYQGFASGDTARDAYAVRLFVEDGHPTMLLSQSFAKNMGLYGGFNIFADADVDLLDLFVNH